MKLIVVVAGCLLFSGTSMGQTGARKAGATKVRKSAIGGTIRNSRWSPLPKVQAYIYNAETIVASGYSDASGYYETNSVAPGTYDVRFVYPSSKRVTVTGIPVKMLKITELNLASEEPSADTTIAYTELVPPTETRRR